MGKKTQINYRIDEELLREIKAAALKEGKPYTQWINEACLQYLNKPPITEELYQDLYKRLKAEILTELRENQPIKPDNLPKNNTQNKHFLRNPTNENRMPLKKFIKEIIGLNDPNGTLLKSMQRLNKYPQILENIEELKPYKREIEENWELIIENEEGISFYFMEKKLNKLTNAQLAREIGINPSTMKPENLQILREAYQNLAIIISNLYLAGENASELGDDNDSSLLFAQADRLYVALENLEAVITEQEP